MALLILLLLVQVICFDFNSADVIALSDAEEQAAVDAHNQVRIQAGATAMQKLKWNDALAQFAQNTASQCNFEHTTYEARQNVAGFSYIGENIYTVAGNTPQPTIKEAVDDWASEQKDYDLNSNQCNPDAQCLHYTQIVWAQTTDVGCAIGKCDNGVTDFSSMPGYIVFCNYGVGGNIIGQKPYEPASSGQVGSKCQEQFKEVADGTGLCVNGSAPATAPATTAFATTNAPNPATTAKSGTSAKPCESTTAASGGSNCKWDCYWKCPDRPSGSTTPANYVFENCKWDCNYNCN